MLDQAPLFEVDRERGKHNDQVISACSNEVIYQVIQERRFAQAYRHIDQGDWIGLDDRGEGAGREWSGPERGQRLLVADVERAHFAEASAPVTSVKSERVRLRTVAARSISGTSSSSMLPRDGMTLLSEILPAASSSWKIFI